MQRSTSYSYRKPVPEYIPSPPSSPVEPSGSADDSKIPPLPSNWREILLSKAVKPDSSSQDSSQTNLSLASNPRHLNSLSTVQLCFPLGDTHLFTNRFQSKDLSTQRYGGSFSTLPGIQNSGRHARSGRGLPRVYRPPTPPVRSRSHLPQLSVQPASEGISRAHHPDLYLSGRLYPSNPHSNRYLDVYAHSGTGTSLRTTTSFRTEKTTVSSNPSSDWPQRMRNLLNKPTTENLTIPDHASIDSNVKCSSLKINVVGWVKKLQRFVGAHKCQGP